MRRSSAVMDLPGELESDLDRVRRQYTGQMFIRDISSGATTGAQREVVAKWVFEEWHDEYVALGMNDTAAVVESFFEEDGNIFIGVVNGEAVGTVGIEDEDMEDRMHLKPWMTSLYVPVQHRHKGYGSQMLQHALKTADEDDEIETLYIWCVTAREAWYSSHGFNTFERREFHGEDVCVMSRSCC